MSKFIIAGREYDPQAAQRAELTVCLRVLTEQGVGMKTILSDVASIVTSSDLLEDPKLLKSFMCFVWVLRLSAGEDVTFEDANRVALADFQIVADDNEGSDPKAPVVSDPDAGPGL